MQKYLKYWVYGLSGLSIILIMALVISLSNRPKVPDNIRDYKLQHTVDSLNAVIQDNAIERNKLGLQIDSLKINTLQCHFSYCKCLYSNLKYV